MQAADNIWMSANTRRWVRGEKPDCRGLVLFQQRQHRFTEVGDSFVAGDEPDTDGHLFARLAGHAQEFPRQDEFRLQSDHLGMSGAEVEPGRYNAWRWFIRLILIFLVAAKSHVEVPAHTKRISSCPKDGCLSGRCVSRTESARLGHLYCQSRIGDPVHGRAKDEWLLRPREPGMHYLRRHQWRSHVVCRDVQLQRSRQRVAFTRATE